MKAKKQFLILIFTYVTILLQSGKTESNTLKWCDQPLKQGDFIMDNQGKYYAFDDRKLRQFRATELIHHYNHDETPANCVLRQKDFSEYEMGEMIEFPPDQDFEQPVLVKVTNKFFRGENFIWYRGRLHHLLLKPEFMKLQVNIIYQISSLTFDALNKGEPMSASTIPEGTHIEYRKKDYIYTRQGLRKIDRQNLSKIQLSPYGNLQIADKEAEKMNLGPDFELINDAKWPNNILIKGKSERLYLLKNDKRYFFWHRNSAKRKGFNLKVITEISDDELFMIPYAGTIF
jgi:hypothetical protein